MSTDAKSNVPTIDQTTQDKIKQFFKDTQSLHKEMAMKRAEKQALMKSETPDPQAVAKPFSPTPLDSSVTSALESNAWTHYRLNILNGLIV